MDAALGWGVVRCCWLWRDALLCWCFWRRRRSRTTLHTTYSAQSGGVGGWIPIHSHSGTTDWLVLLQALYTVGYDGGGTRETGWRLATTTTTMTTTMMLPMPSRKTTDAREKSIFSLAYHVKWPTTRCWSSVVGASSKNDGLDTFRKSWLGCHFVQSGRCLVTYSGW